VTDPQKQLAAALGRVPSGLFILTARQGDTETGLLASWVQQCSFKPPLLTFCVQSGRDIARLLQPGAAFTLNILDDTQTDMIAHFGKGFALTEPAFTGLDVERPADWPTVLTDALACLHGKVVARYAAGDHDLLLGEVLAGRMLGEGHPMVHVRKSGMHY
jgi:flavin reductase (DIM6/NTAB) family NADH-FMN oxidoreductase RutF